MSNETVFKPVREVYDGGEGVPVPVYLCTYRGHTLHVLSRGEAQTALDWIKGRDRFAAVIVQIDGKRREVARGQEPARVL